MQELTMLAYRHPKPIEIPGFIKTEHSKSVVNPPMNTNASIDGII